LETELAKLKMEKCSNDLKFRDVQDNCRLLEVKILPKVDKQTKLIIEITKELITINKEVENLPDVFKREKITNKTIEADRDTALEKMKEAKEMIENQQKEIVEIEHNFTVKEKISGMALYNSNQLKDSIAELKLKIQEMNIVNVDIDKKFVN